MCGDLSTIIPSQEIFSLNQRWQIVPQSVSQSVSGGPGQSREADTAERSGANSSTSTSSSCSVITSRDKTIFVQQTPLSSLTQSHLSHWRRHNRTNHTICITHTRHTSICTYYRSCHRYTIFVVCFIFLW